MSRLSIAVAAVGALALSLAACSPGGQSGGENVAGAGEAEVAGGAAGERFYGQEEFTILYKQTGVETGEVVEHVRAWGRERAEISKMKLSFAGISQSKDNRIVFNGANMATIDNATGAVSLQKNPLYEDVVAAMRGRSGVEFGKEIMTRMGGRATGEKGAFAGQDCDFWELQQLGARVCVTPWGATLYNKTTLGGIAFERTATEVRMGDGGPDAAFTYDESKATQGPDLEDALSTLKDL